MSSSPQHAEEVFEDTPEQYEDEEAPDTPRKRSSGKKKWWILGVIVVVVLAVVIVVLLTRPSNSTPATVTRTQTVQAAMQTLQTTVAASGTINPAQRADLSFTSSGTVKSVKVSVGDAVKKGQSLASIDLTDLKSAVDAAQSAVDAAQTDYNSAVKSGTTASINATKSTLKSKQNDLANAKTALSDGTLTAPFAGTVAIVNISVGDKITASGGSGNTGSNNTGSGNSGYGNQGSSNTGSSTSSGTAITVISTDTYQVSTSVGSADVGSVKKGQDCTVTPNGTTARLPGTIDSVGVIATSSDSSGATFPVVIDITGQQDGLYAGVSASITIVTSSRQALTIPTAAITYSGRQAYVQKQTDSGTEQTPVQTGDTSSGFTEITAGLNEGDSVVITITISASATNGGGLGGFATMFGGGNGGNRQRPSGAGTGGGGRTFNGGNGQGGFPSGMPTDFQGQGGFPTDGQMPGGGQPTS